MNFMNYDFVLLACEHRHQRAKHAAELRLEPRSQRRHPTGGWWRRSTLVEALRHRFVRGPARNSGFVAEVYEPFGDESNLLVSDRAGIAGGRLCVEPELVAID